jgi:outer membrane protein OmpA-like peptidoglycan-associated protein
MKKYIIYLFLVVATLGMAQKDVSPAQQKKQAKKMIDVGDYYTAVNLYRAATQADPEDMDGAYRLAELLLITRNYTDALAWFEKVYLKAPLSYPKAQYFYAQGLMRAGNYEEAKKEFTTFKKKYKGPDKSQYRKMIKSDLKSCDLAMKLLKKPVDVKITHMEGGINRAYTESGPIALGDTAIIYSSMPYDSMYWECPEDAKDENKEKFHAKLYIAAKRNGAWMNVGEFEDGPFNEDGKFVGNGAYSRDGKRFYFTRCDELEGGKIECKIYESKLIGKEWQPGKLLNEKINLPGSTNTQPTLGWDTKKKRDILYFVSDREDGLGGLDIYYSVFDRKKTKDWTAPRNLKRKVNTVGDDMTPYYDMESGTLYFSSANWPGMGGLDVQKVVGSMKKWSKVENAGYPLNTGADELYFVPNESREGGYFTSNREGGLGLHHATCCDDIYSFDYLQIIRIGIEGIVVDANDPNNRPMSNVVVSLYLIQEDGSDVLIKTDTTGKDGSDYFLKLQANKRFKLQAYKKGYFAGETSVSTHGFAKSDTIQANEIRIEKLPEADQGITMKVFFDFGSTALNEEAKKALDEDLIKRLKENPLLVVEVGAHTDDVGSELANITLSQKRAQSIVQYCAYQGINPKKLISRGYGESDPIAANKNRDGSDNPQGRAKNRRVEFKVLNELSEESLYDDDDY